jgi:DNA mismatch repair protein MutS
MAAAAGTSTPLMGQYARIKGEYPDAILLFRVGDFYETFGSDAVTAARALGIQLTRRNNGGSAMVELAGFPHHALETYLPKLVRAGHRVAICDQLEDPKLAKGVVERGVTEVVTPGVAFSDQVVQKGSDHWLAAVCQRGARYGVAFADVTTGAFLVGEGDQGHLLKFLGMHPPREVLYAKGADVSELRGLAQVPTYALDPWVFHETSARERLLAHFGTVTLKGFGVDDLQLGQGAAAAILHYLQSTKQDRLAHFTRLGKLSSVEHLWLDRVTLRDLEVLAPTAEGGRSLVQAVDATATPMGARLLRRWLVFPLLDTRRLNARLDVVQAFVEDASWRAKVCEELALVGDLERTIGKAATRRIQPREMLGLARSLQAASRVCALLQGGAAPAQLAANAPTLDALSARIFEVVAEDTAATLVKGGVVRQGVHADLDELRTLGSNAKEALLAVQQREADRTGITSLKAGFNSVFGYYLEVRNTHKARVPTDWVRKQTLVNAERYVTEELKDLEERILSAEERVLALETELFQNLVQEVCAHIATLQAQAILLARMDVLAAFAAIAERWRYVRPTFLEGAQWRVVAGRHPVIEQGLTPGQEYVANDLEMDAEHRQMLMITGPNMSGKSAVLRQTALISLLAQVGSFVPAEQAQLGLVDRIFTRVGASDDLSSGESTFMVEMNETASILHNLSPRSLVLMDEIGRGTSTYDGISIAWSVAEFLHQHPARPKVLFATHYHELNEMASNHPRIHNMNVAVREVDGKVLFLRKLVPGGSDRSFGIQVARMAGLPAAVVERAQRVLAHLEADHSSDLAASLPTRNSKPRTASVANTALQLSIFQLDDPALEGIRARIAALDINTLTPVEALLELSEIKRLVSSGGARLKKA